MPDVDDRAQRSPRHRLIGMMEPRPQLPPQRVVRHGTGEPAHARVWTMAATIDCAQHDVARANRLRRSEGDAGKPPRDPLSGIAGAEEEGIALEEQQSLFDRL